MNIEYSFVDITVSSKCGYVYVLDGYNYIISEGSGMSNEVQYAEDNSIINRLLQNSNGKVPLQQSQIKQLISKCKNIFLDQPMLLRLEAPIKIVGNIHGQFSDLINIFKMSGYPCDTNYLFLGNYVDRGHMSLECVLLLISFKVKYPENVFLLRGNHQISSVNRLFGFYDECKTKIDVKIWKLFNEMFNVMPLAAVIERKIFCVHAGLSPELENVEQINKIQRPLEITNQGIPLDLLWSDPESYTAGWQENERGVSYIFGGDSVVSFLRENKLDLIVRSHQVVELGYEFNFNRQILTIFSAPNYMGEYENYGAVLVVDQGLKCSFEIIMPKSTKRAVSKEKVPAPFKK